MPATTEVPSLTAETSPKANSRSNQKPVKRSRGRPLQHGTRTLEMGADGIEREVITKAPPIPMPPNPVMGYNTKFPDLAFFEYWQKTDTDFPQRLTGYLYRLWPMIDRERSQQEKPKENRIKNIDKLFKPPFNDMELYHRYGAGDYDIRLNDAGSGGSTICRCFLRGNRDMQLYPPQIKLEELVTEDPINRPYIQWAKASGVFKDDEGDDMAQVGSAEAIESLVDGMKDMAQQAVEQADKRAEASRTSDEGKRSLDVDAAAKSMEIVASAANMGTKMIESAVSRARELSDPGAQAAVLDKLMDLASKFAGIQAKGQTPTAPGGIDTGKLLEMFMEREMKLQSSVLALTEARFKDLETRLQQPNAGQPNPSDPLAQTRNMLSFFKELDEFRGGGEGTIAKPTMWDNLPKIFTGLAALGSVIVTGMHNAAVMKTGQGTPVQPQLAAPEPEEGQPTLQIPGQTQPDPANPMAQYHRFLEGIRLPMLGMMNDEGRETPGADFADWLMEAQGGGPQGRQFYEGLKAQGPDSIKALFQSYPPLWNQLAQIEAKFDTFLTEFLNHDEIRQAEIDQEESVSEQPTARPTRKVKVIHAPEVPPAA